MPFTIPENLDFPLYFNIAFFSILGLGILFGFLRGFKNSLYGFIVTLIFFVAFFLTIDLVVNALWTMNLPFLGGLLENVDPVFSGVTSFSGIVPIAVETYLGESLGDAATNVRLLEFAASLGIFALKIVYTLIYFTVIHILYRLLTFLIRIIFFRTRKAERKYRSKNRGFGALFGLLSGVMSLYVTLIIFGGIMSISESMLVFIPEDFQTEETELAFPREHVYEAGYSVIPLAEDPMAEVEDAIAMLESMVNAYHANIIVSTASEVTIKPEADDEPLELNLYLFDSVLSFVYREQEVPLRAELDIYARVASTVLSSGILESQDVADITGDDISSAFTLLAESNLFTSVLPLAIEVGTNMYETDIPVPIDELYEINWETEVQQIGEIGAMVFEFVNTAGLLEEDPDIETVVFDGDDIREIFTALGDSELMTLAAYVAVEPLLEMAGADIEAVITVPEDLDWSEEFDAIGEIIGAMLDTQVTYGEISSGDPMTILQAISSLDFTVILESKIITQGLINLLEGAGNLLPEDVLAFLDIPDGINWLDEYSDLGVLIAKGELHEILEAVNAMTTVVADLDFDNLGINSISELDLTAIDAIFDSQVMVASLTKLLKEQDFGEFSLIIPDSVYDVDGYLLKTELVNLVDALEVIVTDLACDPGDTECEETGFDIDKAFTLSEQSIDVMLESDILWATVGNLVMDMGEEFLIVPDSTDARTEILVEGDPLDVIAKEEISRMFEAVSLLGITDLDDFEFDSGMVTDIAGDDAKVNTLLLSVIVCATVGDLLYDMGADVLTIPEDATATITAGDVEYTIVTADEIRNLLKVVSLLEIDDVETMEIDPSILTKLADESDETLLDEDKADTLFASLIIHATLSKVLIDLTEGEEAVLMVPYYDQDNIAVRTMNDVDAFEWISEAELRAVIQAILLLDITDFESISIDTLDLDNIIANSGTILESAILHATISDQFINLDQEMIVIPEYDITGDTHLLIEVGADEQRTTYILSDEIEKTLDAIQVLNLDLENPTVDATIIDELELEADPTQLDDDKLTTLFDSAIIQASLSKMILDFTESDGTAEAILVVPYKCRIETEVEDVPVRIMSHETEYITSGELTKLFKAYHSLDIADFEAIDTLDLDKIIANFSVLIASATLHATISDQIINLESDAIVIPDYTLAGAEIVFILGDAGFQNTFIAASEIEETLDALQVMGIDFNNPTFDAGLIDNLAMDEDPDMLDEEKLDEIFDSTILHASISKMLFDLSVDDGETEAVLVVPYLASNLTVVRFDDGHGIEYVSETELRYALKAMYALDITNFDNVETLTLTKINLHFSELMDSAILHATVSDQMLTVESEDVEIPYYDVDGTSIRQTVGIGLEATTYITETELDKTLAALEQLGIDNFTSVEVNIVLADYYEEENRNLLMDSATVHRAISKQLFDVGVESLEIPFYDQFGAEIRVIKGDPLIDTDTEYVTKGEIHALFEVLEVLEIPDLKHVGINLDLTKFYEPGPRQILMDAASVQLEISKQLLGLGPDKLAIPYKDIEDHDVRITTGEPLVETDSEYVSQTEIHAMFEVLELLGIESINDVDINIDLNIFYDQPGADPDQDVNRRNTLMASAAVHAEISRQILEIDDATLDVPFVDQNDDVVRLTLGDPLAGTDTEYLVKQEIHDLFEVLELLEISGLNITSITLDLGDLYDLSTREVLLAPACVHLKVSTEMLALGQDILYVPSKDVDENDIQIHKANPVDLVDDVFILTDEIHYFFEGLELLGLPIDHIDEFSGAINLNVLYIEANRIEMLKSATLHMTISDQLLERDPAFISVPNKNIEDDLFVRLTVGADTFINKEEIHNFFDGLNALGLDISDISEFEGDFELSRLYDDEYREPILESAIMHATFSDQIINIDPTKMIVPEKDVDDQLVRQIVAETEFVVKSEINNMMEALEVLALPIDDIGSFGGTFDMAKLYDVNVRNLLLASASVHATISKQMLDLDDGGVDDAIIIPEWNVSSTLQVRKQVLTTDFIDKNEIHAFFEAIETLGLNLTVVGDFTGAISLANFVPSEEPEYYDDNQNTLLESAIIHATISDQMLGRGSAILNVPTADFDGTTIQEEVSGTAFVYVSEIKHLINALDIIGVYDIATFNGEVDISNIYDSGNQDTLLLSASMHLTISDQILGLDGDEMEIPDSDFLGNPIQKLVGMDKYVYKTEIKNLIEALEILSITDIENYNGVISLSAFFASESPLEYQDNQDALLDSASMHATISKQLLDLSDEALIVPDTDHDNVPVQKSVGLDNYIYDSEIKAIIDALDVLGLGSTVSSMNGTFTLANLGDAGAQDILLLSASMHATISQKVFDINDTYLKVPNYKQDGVTELRIERGLPGLEREFVIKDEIKALIDALNILGYTNLDTTQFTTEFALSDNLFNNPGEVFASSIIQAMFSERMFEDTAGTLIIPNTYYGIPTLIRIELVDVDYIDHDELVALVTSLGLLGLDDFSNFSFSPANIFLLDDYDTLLASEIMQATVSDNLLAPPTLDETAPAGSARLIIPNYFRQAINVGLGSETQIEIDELKALLASLDTLGVSAFGDNMDATDITGIFLDQNKRDIFLGSGSMHITTDNMLHGNANIVTSIPDLAQETAYGINDVTTKDEITNFILAANAMAGANFTEVSFSFLTIIGLTPAEQDTILTSMIVRNIITPDVINYSETIPAPVFPFETYAQANGSLDQSDYEGNSIANFLLKASIIDVISYYTS